MANPTKNLSTGKPDKPYPDFPLFAHASGRWAKKVRAMKGMPGGEMRYFGPWNDPDGALAKWLEQRDELLGGKMPRAVAVANGIALVDIVNKFLSAKHLAHQSGELSHVLFVKYHGTCARLLEHFGKSRLVTDIKPEDWGTFRAAMAAKWGPVTLGAEIQRIRTVFNFAHENDKALVPVMDYGSMFKKPSRKVLRVHKRESPKKFFAPEEIRAQLKAADTQMEAMILLGINAGFGNTDVAGLREHHLELGRGIVHYSRTKTGVDRRATLWPETVKALRKVLKERPAAKVATDADLVFITKYGNPWRQSGASVDAEAGHKVKWTNVDSVGLEFGKLLRKLKMKSKGRNFYSLRHSFKTIAERAGDPPAVDRIMGHEKPDDIGTEYREWLGDAAEDARLRKVTNHVRKWVYGR